jgi:hypothetical protein
MGFDDMLSTPLLIAGCFFIAGLIGFGILIGAYLC